MGHYVHIQASILCTCCKVGLWSEVSKMLQREWEDGCMESISKSWQAVTQTEAAGVLVLAWRPFSRNKFKMSWKELFSYSVLQCTVLEALRESEQDNPIIYIYVHVYIYEISIHTERYIYIKVKRPVLWSLHSLLISDRKKKTTKQPNKNNQPKTCADEAESQQNYRSSIPTVVEVHQIIFSTVC